MNRTALASLVAGVAFLFLMLLLVPGGGRSSDFELFIGRFHPMIVHLPIGLLFFGAVLELLSRRWPTMEPPVLLLLYAGAWTAILAAVAGLYLARGGGYDTFALAWHKRLGVLIAVAATAACVLKMWPALQQRPARTGEQHGYVASVGALVLLVALTGHLGGSMTHGEGFLTRYMPDGLRTVAGLVAKEDIGKLRLADPAKATVYGALVAPVLEDRCQSCHRDGLSRGGLAMDTPEALLAGGDDGPVVVAGRADESTLIRRIWLPLNADGHMPPEGSRQLTVAEAALIRWWIDAGASLEMMLAEAETTPTIQSILDGYGLDEIKTGIFALDIDAPDSTAMYALRAQGVSVTALAEDVPFLQVRCTNLDACATDDFVQGLRPLARHVAWLDLSRTRVDDGAVAVVRDMPHLTRLYLQQTAITDAALAHLEGLEYLEYLNVYDTEVTDAGLEGLASLPSLASLYLWQTQVSDSGVAALKGRAPALYVNTGLSLAPPDTMQDAEEE